MEQPIVIIDTNAFIRSSQLLNLGATSVLITTPAVINQVRDQKTRQMLNSFPFQIKIQQPNSASIKFVTSFATKTGDIANLSETDIQIISLGYQLCTKNGFQQKLNKQPKQIQQPKLEQQIESDQYSEPSYSSDQLEQIKEKEKSQEDDGWIVVQPKNKKKYQSEDQDDDEGWITPQNYEQKKHNNQIQVTIAQQEQGQKIPISIITSDFAMQNVIFQIGIPIKSVDGLQIKSVKRFILQCYLCWKLYKDVAANKIRTCDKCGYNSLSKVSYSLDSHGNMVLHRKKGWKPNKQVFQWKQKMMYEQAQRKKNRRKKQKKTSIFE